jgi:hypothetical protein
MVAAAVAKKAPKPTTDNAMLYLLGGIVVLSLAKRAALKAFEPLAKVAKQTVYVGDQLTGGIQGDPTTVTYWTEVDWPFTDVQTPLVNLKEPDQNWMDYVTEVDLPGVPEYNVRELPGDIKGMFGRIF